MEACFIGHRTIEKSDDLSSILKKTIIALVNKGVTTFLFGSKSEFDSLSWEIVTQLKLEFPHIKRVYVRSNFQHIDKTYESYLSKSYEDTYFPKRLENAGKSSYVVRNYEMIERSQYCIFYYNNSYKGHNSGTAIAFKYAIRRKKIIINSFI